MILHNLFPVPVFTTNVSKMFDVHTLNKDLIGDIDNEIMYNPKNRSTLGNSNQTKLRMELEYRSFKTLQNYIQYYVDYYFHNIGIKNPEKTLIVDHLWGNKLEKSGWNYPHIHGTGSTVFAGVYYPDNTLDASDIEIERKGLPGDLVLFDPSKNIKQAVRAKDTVLYPYYGDDLTITPKYSGLVLFPNYLQHMVLPTNKTRYSISFSVSKV